jgi:hypothetical protein
MRSRRKGKVELDDILKAWSHLGVELGQIYRWLRVYAFASLPCFH